MIQPEQIIIIESSDHERFQIRRAIAEMSMTLKHMLEDLAESGASTSTSTSTSIPIPNIKGSVLKRVIEYCDHFYDHPDETTSFRKGGTVDSFSSWDTTFTNELKQDLWILFETILAANFLDIKSLLELTCRTVAGLIKGKTPEEICKTFNIKRDFTEEELEQVRKDNPWIGDL